MGVNQEAVQQAPAWLGEAEAAGNFLDVRPLLESGEDPLLRVIQLSMTVRPDGFMVIEAPFNPLPLRSVLAGQGYSSWARRLGEAYWRVAFRRDGLGTGGEEGGGETCGGVKGEGRTWQEDGTTHIDVRGLPPPVPMLSILRLVKRLGPSDCIIVHHEREPMYLIPELAELGWQVQQVPGEPGEVRLRISRMPE